MTKAPALLLFTLALTLGARVVGAASATPPRVGEVAPDFTLRTLDERAIELKSLTEKNPVVLVVLRGWPGYQCPLCTRQARDFVAHAEHFKQRGAQVLMVYPGPAEQLKAHAGEFLRDQSWPSQFLLVLDPDYAFTNAYGLRWHAKSETAYPSTFIVGRDGRVTFAEVSKSHGGRVTAERTLAELK
jgi:peroxiredoxin